MIVAAGVLIALGLGLLKEWRMAAYLAFLATIFGISASLGGALGSAGLVAGLFWLILTVELVGAIILFGLLWASKPAAQTA